MLGCSLSPVREASGGCPLSPPGEAVLTSSLYLMDKFSLNEAYFLDAALVFGPSFNCSKLQGAPERPSLPIDLAWCIQSY
ncbi:hypothetical protein MHYP_G00181950 [Metynnis hypsauchen]